MGKGGHSIKINEVVSYLHSHAPDAYKRLLSAGIAPELMARGVPMGDLPPVIDEDLLIAQCKIVSESLGSALIKSSAASHGLRLKIVKLRQIRFATTVFTALASAVTSLSAYFGEDAVTIAASIAAFGSTLANAGAAQLVLAQSGTEAEVLGIIEDLEAAHTFSAVTRLYLDAVAAGNYPTAEAAALVQEANRYFAKLVEALKKATKYMPTKPNTDPATAAEQTQATGV